MNFFLDLFSVNTAYASFESFLGNVNKLIINPIISFLFALALVYFLFGVFQFFYNAEDEESKTTGKSHMLWGVVGITIMFGVWAILGIITNTLNIQGQIDPKENKVTLPNYVPPSPNNLPRP